VSTIRSARAAILLCALGAMAESLFYTALAPILPAIDEQLGITHTLAGVLVAGYAIGYVLGTYPGYWLAMRTAPRTAGAAGVALVALGTLGFAAADDYPLLLAARVFVGAGSVIVYTGVLAAAADMAGAEARGSAIGRVYAGSAAGGAVGPLVGAAAQAAGRGVVFGLVAVGQVAVALLLSRLPASAPLRGASLREMLAHTRHRRVRLGLWITAVPGFAMGVLTVAGSYRIAELGGTSLAIAAAFSGIAVINVFLNPRIGRLSDRVGRERPVALTLLVAAAMLVAIALAAFEASTIVLIAMTGALMTAIGGPGLAMVGDEIARHGGDPAQATFLMNLSWGPTAVVGAIAAGVFHGHVGAELALALLCAVALATAAVVFRDRHAHRPIGE
jgi:DHA1 family inner membrane transport protein